VALNGIKREIKAVWLKLPVEIEVSGKERRIRLNQREQLLAAQHPATDSLQFVSRQRSPSPYVYVHNHCSLE